MERAAGPTEQRRLGEFIDAYEEAQGRDGGADLAAFLPPRDHPLYDAVLRELIRVDLEYHWERGQPRCLHEYAADFPDLFRDRTALRDVAFEEYRLRFQAGERPAPREYEQRYGVDTSAWPALPEPAAPACSSSWRSLSVEQALVVEDVNRSDHAAAERLAQAVTRMPAVGSRFLGFRLLAELGRGAFARVFLAQQGELADRFVVLKIAPNLAGEVRSLAQLQHTHIVPIYSVHRAGPFQAICMPFFGATTLAHVLRNLRGSTVLPTSGKGLVGTLDACKSATRLLSEKVKEAEVGSAEPGDGSIPAHVPAHSATHTALANLTYVEAVLWIGVRLADGLAHAHERGILHRDLKPANVLLTDDGQPMLLDFNLSADTKLGSSAAAAQIGGTLPYMAPEHLEAFQGGARPVDARSDVYSLGVLLHELLTGRHPYPLHHGPIGDTLPRLLADRLQPPPRLRGANQALSPAVESMVRHCLEPDPARRYQSAQQLRDDLQRQLDHLPLRHAPEPSLWERFRKWRRRHPRLTSTTTVAAGALVVLLALTGGFLAKYRVQQQEQERLDQLGAIDTLVWLREQLRPIQVLLSMPNIEPTHRAHGLALCRQVLERYRVLNEVSWEEQPAVQALPTADRDWLREHIGEVLLHYVRGVLREAEAAQDDVQRREYLALALHVNQRTEACYPPDQSPRSLWLQRARLYELTGRGAEARALREQAEALPVRQDRDCNLLLGDLLMQGQVRQALSLLREKVKAEKDTKENRLHLGLYFHLAGQPAQALESYQAALRLDPQYTLAYYYRGLAQLDLKNYAQARADLDQALALQPDLHEAHFNRAVACHQSGDHAGALDDLNHFLNGSPVTSRAYFLRARVLAQLGERKRAGQDHQEAMRRPPSDEKDWIVRAVERLPRDVPGALADLDKALALNPRSRAALQDKASILAEYLGRTEEATALLDKVLDLYPEYVPARIGRGVLLARLGRRAAAHADTQAALAQDRAPDTVYRAACVYALTSSQDPDDHREALRHLADALRRGFGFEHLDTDRDLDALRARPEFKQLVDAVRMLRAGDKSGR